MVDWLMVSNLATGGGTLVLAVATFGSVRSANRSARVAERALRIGLRPLLVPSRTEDRTEKIFWMDEHWARLPGGRALVEVTDNGNIYLAISVRNVGNGIGAIRAWDIRERYMSGPVEHRELSEFRPHTRDLYVPAGDLSFWQAALRDPSDEHYPLIRRAAEQRLAFTVDIMYTDHEDGQHTISRFGVLPAGEDGWVTSVGRHWTLNHSNGR